LETEKKEFLSTQKVQKSKFSLLIKTQKELESQLNKIGKENEDLQKQVRLKGSYIFKLVSSFSF
jgi:uncharacterized protein YfcZ (UPF0381/DUF406 family)